MSDLVKIFSWYIASGALLGVPFVVPAFWFCGLFGVAVFVYATKLTKTPRAVLMGGFVAWTTKSLIALFFGWSVWPVDASLFTLPLSGFWVIAMYWISSAVFLGAGGAFVSGWLWYVLVHKNNQTAALAILPLLWPLGEFLAARLFSVMTIGPEGFYNAAFSYGQLGYLLAEHNILILLAKFGGLYLLTFVAVLLGIGLWYGQQIFYGNKRILAGSTAILILILSSGLSLPLSHTLKGDSVAVIDTEFNNQTESSREETMLRRALLNEAVDVALATGALYVLLPEGARFNDANLSAEQAYELFRFQSGDAPVILIDSGRAALAPKATALRATIYDGVSKNVQQTDKQYLVPQGEYVPLYFGALFSLLVDKDTVSNLSTLFDYVPGPYNNQTVLPDNLPRVLFCHSSADPVGVRKILADGAKVPFIAHPISHSWFGGSQILKHQQAAMLRIQALWNNVTIVSAGNMTKGELYDKDGSVRKPVEVERGERWTVSIIDL